jgi:hypothetical protein
VVVGRLFPFADWMALEFSIKDLLSDIVTGCKLIDKELLVHLVLRMLLCCNGSL